MKKIYTLDDIIDFGKYKDQSFKEIIKVQPNYIIWCLKNIEWFCLSDELFNVAIERKEIEKEALIKLWVEKNEEEMTKIEEISKIDLFKLNEIKKSKIKYKNQNNTNNYSANEIFYNYNDNDHYHDDEFRWGGLAGDEAYDAMWNCD